MKDLREFVSGFQEDECFLGEALSQHTSFHTGGPADLYLAPRNRDSLIRMAALLRDRDLPFFLLGAGSNLLISDDGFDGAVLHISKALSGITVDGERITAEAGCMLTSLAKTAQEYRLSGLEFAYGIPGSVGGAVFMNAGAYGGEIRDVFESAEILTKEGSIETWNAEKLAFGYRSSHLQECGGIVLSASFILKKGDGGGILAKMEELMERRRTKQPLEYPSAGSTFKRPEGHFAGKLIEEAGLRGYRIGGAQVSEKHCGFVINADHATSLEIYALIRHIQITVKEHSGVELIPEVRFVGNFS